MGADEKLHGVRQSCRFCGHADVDLTVTIPAELSHTGEDRQAVKPIDACLAPFVEFLNSSGAVTTGSCCGHGEAEGWIDLVDGRRLELRRATRNPVKVLAKDKGARN